MKGHDHSRLPEKPSVIDLIKSEGINVEDAMMEAQLLSLQGRKHDLETKLLVLDASMFESGEDTESSVILRRVKKNLVERKEKLKEKIILIKNEIRKTGSSLQ
jgi:hypothetical protein